MKILILAVMSLGLVAQAQRRPNRPNPNPPPAASDNICNISAKETTLSGSGETVSSMADCAQKAFEAADRYCNAARAGEAGNNPYNPINTSWTWNGQTGTHPNFECANVAYYPPKGGSGNNGNNVGNGGGGGGRPGGGGGRPGGGGGGGGSTEPRIVEEFEFTEAEVREWLPRDVCLIEHPRWGRDFRRNRDRFTIDREDAFCDWDEKYLRFQRCNPQPQPVSSYLPGTEHWVGDTKSLTLGNQGQPVTVTLTSQEQVTQQYFENTARDYNCSEPDDSYRVRYTTYRVTRWSDGRRERVRTHSDTDWVRGIRLKMDPIWTARRQNVPTGDSSESTFTIEPQAFETQLNYSFGATITHTTGSDPRFSFSDEFFSHRASFGNVSNGGTVSIQSDISPITSPSVSISMNETKKRVPVLERLKVYDPRLPQLRSMSSNQMETTYTISGKLMHKKVFGDKDLGSFTVAVPNRENNPNMEIDMDEVLRIAAQQTGNQNFILNRREKTYELKLQVSASRTNTKFVREGESARTPEIKAEIEKQ